MRVSVAFPWFWDVTSRGRLEHNRILSIYEQHAVPRFTYLSIGTVTVRNSAICQQEGEEAWRGEQTCYTYLPPRLSVPWSVHIKVTILRQYNCSSSSASSISDTVPSTYVCYPHYVHIYCYNHIKTLHRWRKLPPTWLRPETKLFIFTARLQQKLKLYPFASEYSLKDIVVILYFFYSFPVEVTESSPRPCMAWSQPPLLRNVNGYAH